jgi:hypothetical protein
MKCAIDECRERADVDGGALCKEHQQWTASRMRRAARAIETAITSEDGLDGLVGERILREVGYWKKPQPEKGPQ